MKMFNRKIYFTCCTKHLLSKSFCTTRSHIVNPCIKHFDHFFLKNFLNIFTHQHYFSNAKVIVLFLKFIKTLANLTLVLYLIINDLFVICFTQLNFILYSRLTYLAFISTKIYMFWILKFSERKNQIIKMLKYQSCGGAESILNHGQLTLHFINVSNGITNTHY